MDDALNESIGLNMLRQVKLLDPLGELQLMTLAKRLSSCKYSEEDVIIQQGNTLTVSYSLLRTAWWTMFLIFFC